MAPNVQKNVTLKSEEEVSEEELAKMPYKATIQWSNVAVNLFIHLGFFVGFYYLITGKLMAKTYVYFFVLTAICNLSVTIGVHRLWSHRSFKCNRAVKLLLIFFYTMAGQSSIFHWCQIHRVHHKFSETIKDPLDVNRGFFFAHVGWYCLTYHPACELEMKRIDLSDIKADKDVMFQYKYYSYLYVFLNFLAVILPCYFWGESLWIAFWTCYVSRFTINFTQLNFTNSANHFIGKRPYDKAESATDNIACTLFSFGEGYHNYHHCFPFDYRTGEFGDIGHYNLSAVIIDFWASMGWAWDRKKVSQDMINRRVLKSGDGSHYLSHDEAHKSSVWGYGDEAIDKADQEDLDRMNE